MQSPQRFNHHEAAEQRQREDRERAMRHKAGSSLSWRRDGPFMGGVLGAVGLIMWAMLAKDGPSRAEIAAEVAMREHRQQVERFEQDARKTCSDAVIRRSQYPAKASVSWINRTLQRADDGGIVINGRADFMNGFGAMIPHTYICVIGRDGALKHDVSIYRG